MEIQNNNMEIMNNKDILENTNNVLNNKISVIEKTLYYLKNDKIRIITDILNKNNTIMPDFMERKIIGNVYDYIIEKLDLLIIV